jgi:uncharacterized protein
MIFAANIEYIADKEKIDLVRPKHRQYLLNLLDNGALVASGPFLDGYGALIIYEASTLEEAEQLLKDDPFHAEGIFVQWIIRPWKPIMSNSGLLPERP